MGEDKEVGPLSELRRPGRQVLGYIVEDLRACVAGPCPPPARGRVRRFGKRNLPAPSRQRPVPPPQGRVSPDSFTHGTSEQRVRWFRTGLQNGDPERCDTFASQNL